MGMEARRKMRFAMVCSSNMNRSMEAHSLLGRAGLDVASYGTGTHVKLPGPSLHEPNVYDFGTPYNVIYDDLRRKDPDLSVLLLFSLLNSVFFPGALGGGTGEGRISFLESISNL